MLSFMKRCRWILIPLSICVLIIALMKTVFFLGYVPTASMEPTIPSDSWILGMRIYDELQIGDIVIFTKDAKTLVKRIVAVGGDTVYIDDEEHIVNVNHPEGRYTRTLSVPAGSYFVLGDNAEESIDARYWEEPFISLDCVLAKII